ncbi:MAG: hypothetical protein V3U62_09980, partial [Sedimenticolaceae bacterium]
PIGSLTSAPVSPALKLLSVPGFGVTVLTRSILSDKMRELEVQEGFPGLPESVISLLRPPHSRSPAIDCLASHIFDSFRSESTPISNVA